MDLFTYTKEDAAFSLEYIVGITWMDHQEPHGSLLSTIELDDTPFDLRVLGTDGGQYLLTGIVLPGGAKANGISQFEADSYVRIDD